MPECDVTHCSEPGVQRIQHPRAPLEVRWLCRDHLAGWLKANPTVPSIRSRRVAPEPDPQRVAPTPSPATRANNTLLPMTEPDMSFPTETDLITLKAIMEAAGQKTRGELADALDITLPAFKSRMYRLQADGVIKDGEDGLKWDYVVVTDKGAQVLAEAAAQAELEPEQPAQDAEPDNALASSAGPIQGQAIEDDIIIDDPEPKPADYAHGLAVALGYDLHNTDCPPWADLLEEVEDIRAGLASEEAQEQLAAARAEADELRTRLGKLTVELEAARGAHATALAAVQDMRARDAEVQQVQTRACNQAEVIEVLRRDLAAAKAAAADPQVLTELQDLQRESLEVLNALEGFPGRPTTKQGKAVLSACRNRDEALAEVRRLRELAGSYQQDAAALQQVRVALEGNTRATPERGTLAAEVADLVRQVADLTGAEMAAWERGRVWGRTQVFERLGWIIDHSGARNYTEEGYIEQVRLLKAAADANTDMAFEADEDGILLRLGDPRLGLRTLLASWDEVGPNGGNIHLFGWDGSEYLTVPVTCREMGKSVALALLASRGVQVPELVFVESDEGSDANNADADEVACA